MSDLQKELEPFPDEAGLSFVGSVDDGGFPQVKAMLAPRGREGLRVFRFSTNASSMRVAQFRRNGAACLYFCDPRTFRGLLLTGTMEADGTQWTVTGLLREFNTTSRIMLSLEFLPAEYDPDATPAWLVIGPDVTTGELREAYEAYYGVAEGK